MPTLGPIDPRACLFALLAIGFGAWAMTILPPFDTLTLPRVGPGMAPRAVALALVVVGGLVLVRAATGFANAPPRPLWLPWRLILLVALVALIALEDIVAYFGDEPFIAALAEQLQALAAAGPMELLAVTWLRWTLAIAIGVVAAGEGTLTGLGSLLVGALVGLAGTDVASGRDRLPQIEQLLEQIPAWTGFQGSLLPLLVGMTLALILCRVNFLPAVLAGLGAPAAEDLFRRTMLLGRGDVLDMIVRRPITQMYLAAIGVIVLLMLWYRWPWRRTRQS